MILKRINFHPHAGSVDILVDLLKGKDFETVRRINYLVNIAKQEDLKKSLNGLKSTLSCREFLGLLTIIDKGSYIKLMNGTIPGVIYSVINNTRGDNIFVLIRWNKDLGCDEFTFIYREVSV